MESSIKIDIEAPLENVNAQIIKLTGEIDRETVTKFRAEIDEFLTSFNGKVLIFDLIDLGFINSEGIGYLSDLQNNFSHVNKKIMIAGASERVMDIFYLVGLNQIVDCCNSRDECLNKLQK